MTDEKLKLPFVAISDVGDVREIPGPSISKTRLRRDQVFNIHINTASDDEGHGLRAPPNFPDGHFASPFRAQVWEVISRDEYESRAPPSEDQKNRWAALRAEDDVRRELYRQQSVEWFASIGRYVVHYEAMSAALLRLVRALLVKGGLGSERAADIVVSDQTTRPLSDVSATLMLALMAMNDDDKKISTSIFKRVNACIEVRNFLLHSAWYFGGTQPVMSGQFALATAQKFRKSKRDPTRRSLNFTKEALDGFSDRCTDARTLVTDLCHAVKRGGSLSSFLRLTDGEALERTLRFADSIGGTLVEHYPPVKAYELPPDTQTIPLDTGGPGYDTGCIREMDAKEFVSLMGKDPDS